MEAEIEFVPEKPADRLVAVTITAKIPESTLRREARGFNLGTFLGETFGKIPNDPDVGTYAAFDATFDPNR